MSFRKDFLPIDTEEVKISDSYNAINNGDILMCSGNYYFANMIKKVTQSIWSHTAFMIKAPLIEKVLVCESVESIGTRIVSLDSYFNNYNGSGEAYDGFLCVVRHKDFNEGMAKKIALKAVDLMGHPYDYQEIARIAEKITIGGFIKNLTGDTTCELTLPDDDKKYICSEFVYECFKAAGLLLKVNCLGFMSPADLCFSEDLDLIFKIVK